ncbi:hypothetical protein [Nocardioides sp.]|uniref:hypothetical protein n=1 Tax=Nocardioides sp. TaxID=35761 RepID=UPI002B26553E|nr:hypothetical protein [Nocardioides sp.]
MNFTAESRIIASFTFIAFLVLGAWTGVEALIYRSRIVPFESVGGRVLLLLVPVVATAVAFQATRSTEVSWAKSLGGAAVLLGLLSTMAGLVYLVTNV